MKNVCWIPLCRFSRLLILFLGIGCLGVSSSPGQMDVSAPALPQMSEEGMEETSASQEDVSVAETAPSLNAGSASAETSREEVESAAPKRLKDYDIPGLNRKVNLTSFDPWDVVQLIEFLAHRGGLKNIVVGTGVSGLTTKLKFEDVTVGDAMEVVLSVNRLAYEINGGILTIMTDDEYQTKYGRSFYDNKTVRVVELEYADPSRVAGMLEPIKSLIGTVVADPITGTLILIDTPEKIVEMKNVIRKADIATISRVIPTETKTFQLQYAELEDIQGEVSALLSKQAGSVRVDRRTRSLIVTDLAHNMRKIEKLIEVFDQRPKEVFIEAKIVQVSLSDEYNLGVDWNHFMEGVNPRFSLDTDVSPPIVGARGTITETGTGIGSLTYRTILGGGDLTVIVDALKSIGDTKILSNPHVAVLDGHEATIKVVREEPYAEAQLESGTTNVIGETIQFIEVGVSLGVTPRVNDEGLISMSIRPEVSSVEGSYQARFSVPVVQKSFSETTVMVKDGQTIIIAGMIEDLKSQRENRVPFLGRIPLLGLLFRSVSDRTQSQETIVFLTPRIVSGEEPHVLLRDLKKEPKPLRSVGYEKKKEIKSVR